MFDISLAEFIKQTDANYEQRQLAKFERRWNEMLDANYVGAYRDEWLAYAEREKQAGATSCLNYTDWLDQTYLTLVKEIRFNNRYVLPVLYLVRIECRDQDHAKTVITTLKDLGYGESSACIVTNIFSDNSQNFYVEIMCADIDEQQETI